MTGRTTTVSRRFFFVSPVEVWTWSSQSASHGYLPAVAQAVRPVARPSYPSSSVWRPHIAPLTRRDAPLSLQDKTSHRQDLFLNFLRLSGEAVEHHPICAAPTFVFPKDHAYYSTSTTGGDAERVYAVRWCWEERLVDVKKRRRSPPIGLSVSAHWCRKLRGVGDMKRDLSANQQPLADDRLSHK